jgi:hypothetical protein
MKEKKKIVREMTYAVIAVYSDYDGVLNVSIEELIGIGQQQTDSKIIPLNELASFIDNIYFSCSLINYKQYQEKQHTEIDSKALCFVDNLLDNFIINHLLANQEYSPQMRDIFLYHLFRAELLKAIKYPKISYRKFCTKEHINQERKENRRLLSLPLNTSDMIDHTELCHFRKTLNFSQIINILVYILHFFYRSGLLEGSVLHGVDLIKIANDNRISLYTVEIGDKKIHVYNDIDCDSGTHRNKPNKSSYVISYRMQTLAAINSLTGHIFPLISLLSPANHHDSLYLKPLVGLAQPIMDIEIKLITTDQAYCDKDGSLLVKTGVLLITQVSSKTLLPDNVNPETLSVTCDDFSEIPMIRLGLTDEDHEYICDANAGEYHRMVRCTQSRIIPFNNGHFQRMSIDSKLAEQAIDLRKNSERTLNRIKKRECLENTHVRGQHALVELQHFKLFKEAA